MAPSPRANAHEPAPVVSPKRKATDQSEGSVKRRAARACLVCRNRKVRCDAVQSGVPCNNCRLDNVACVLSHSNRRKTTQVSVEREVYSPETDSDHPNDIPMSLTFEVNDAQSVSWENTFSAATAAAAAATGEFAHNSNTTPVSMDQQAFRYPRYICPLPAHVTADDMDYLTKKDALTVPSDHLRGLLLSSYVQYVHPFMPVVDLEDFLTRISREDAAKPVSFLLFQAVLFASVAFVPMEALQEAGFTNRKSARKIFFQRVRLLYELDCEKDRVSVLQSLLLMTYWYENPHENRDTWYYLGLSISLAQLLGLHRDPDKLKISARAKRMHKRLWWCCYIRDRLVALGIRRPARIRPIDFNVSMLTLDDFEIMAMPHGTLRSVCDWPHLLDEQLRVTTAATFIDMAKLCICIGDILFSQYSTLISMSNRAEGEVIPMVLPTHSLEQSQDVARCDAKLADWFQNLDPISRYKPQGARSSKSVDEVKRITHLHQAQLHLSYLTAITILYRPQALQSHSSGEDGPSHKHSKSKVTEAAACVSDVAYDLQNQGHLGHLSTSGIPAILWATFSHLTEISSARDRVNFGSIGRFYQCFQALEELRVMYASADQAVWFLEAVIKKNNIQIPGLSIGKDQNAASRECPSAVQGSHGMDGLQRSGSLPTSIERSQSDPIANGTSPSFTLGSASMPTGGTSRTYYQSIEDQQDVNNIDLGDYWQQSLLEFDSNLGSFVLPTLGNSYDSQGLIDMDDTIHVQQQ